MNVSIQKRDTSDAIAKPIGVIGSISGAEKPAAPVVEFRRYSSVGLDAELVTGAQAVLALEQDWRELESQCGDTLLFQSFDWCANWIAMQEGNPEAGTPVVAVWRSASRIVGLLPLKVAKVSGLKVLTGLAEPFQQYTEMLAVREMAPARFTATFGKLIRASGADFLHLGQVRQDGALAAMVEGVARRSGEIEHSPYVQLSDWPDFDSYHKSVKSKTRKNMRNAVNRLTRSGPVEHEAASKGRLVSEVVCRTFAGRQAWLDRNGITSRAFQDDDFQRFVTRFAEGGVKGVDVLAMSLTHDGKPIADQWGFVYKDRYYAFMSSMDPEYEPVGPGKLHLEEVIRTCYDRDLKVVDFMIPALPYKMTWTERKVAVADFTAPVSLAGQLYCSVWLAALRPLAKDLWFRLPTGVRNMLAKRIF